MRADGRQTDENGPSATRFCWQNCCSRWHRRFVMAYPKLIVSAGLVAALAFVASPAYGYPSYQAYGYPGAGYAPYGYGYGGYSGRPYGGIRIDLPERDAEVYVDGYFVGSVDNFDGVLQQANVEAGPHRVEIRAPG